MIYFIDKNYILFHDKNFILFTMVLQICVFLESSQLIF